MKLNNPGQIHSVYPTFVSPVRPGNIFEPVNILGLVKRQRPAYSLVLSSASLVNYVGFGQIYSALVTRWKMAENCTQEKNHDSDNDNCFCKMRYKVPLSKQDNLRRSSKAIFRGFGQTDSCLISPWCVRIYRILKPT